METDMKGEIEALESLKPQGVEDMERSDDQITMPITFELTDISAAQEEISSVLTSFYDSS